MPIVMKLCMKDQRPKPFIIYLNYEPGLTMTYFTSRSYLPQGEILQLRLLYGKM